MICVVDDDDSCRESVAGLLRSYGYDVRGFASAEAFLDSQQLESAACLVLDVRMPGMSGPALQAELRNRRPHLPIVFVTAHGDEQTRAQVIRDGAIDCLPKPFAGDALLHAIETALGGPHA